MVECEALLSRLPISPLNTTSLGLQLGFFTRAGIVARDGWLGLYRGFLPNALKNLPSSRFVITSLPVDHLLHAIGLFLHCHSSSASPLPLPVPAPLPLKMSFLSSPILMQSLQFHPSPSLLCICTCQMPFHYRMLLVLGGMNGRII